MNVTHDEKIEVLSRTRDIVGMDEGKHWKCGGWGDACDGKVFSVCLMSAINMAMPRRKTSGSPKAASAAYDSQVLAPYEEELMKEIRTHGNYKSVPNFNDSNGWKQVMTVLDATIERLIKERDVASEVPVVEKTMADSLTIQR